MMNHRNKVFFGYEVFFGREVYFLALNFFLDFLAKFHLKTT